MAQLAIDTNLLILLIVGATSTEMIGQHGRLGHYGPDDYRLLNAFAADYSVLILNPHVLSETSSLLADIKEPARAKVFATFRALISAGRETYVPSREASEAPFMRLGLTDAILIELCRQDTAGGPVTLLTKDVKLYFTALQMGLKAVNFTHEQVRAGLREG